METRFSTSFINNHVILHCQGDLDLCSRDALGAALREFVSNQARFYVLDLSNVSFLDCGSLSQLEQLDKTLASDAVLQVVCDSGIVHRLLEVCGYLCSHDVVPSLGSIDGALPAFRRAPAAGSDGAGPMGARDRGAS